MEMIVMIVVNDLGEGAKREMLIYEDGQQHTKRPGISIP
jgi:hypothetical protein